MQTYKEIHWRGDTVTGTARLCLSEGLFCIVHACRKIDNVRDLIFGNVSAGVFTSREQAEKYLDTHPKEVI